MRLAPRAIQIRYLSSRGAVKYPSLLRNLRGSLTLAGHVRINIARRMTETTHRGALLAILVTLAVGAARCDPGGEEPDADGGTDGDGDVEGDADADEVDADQPPCPEDMVLIDDGDFPFCIDRYEHPGAGAVPDTAMAWRFAREACVDARKELCVEEQWARACVGTSQASCLGPQGRAGARPDCVSAFGVFDMVGNVAEWTASPGGAATWFVRGGSASTEEIACDFREEIRAESARLDIGLRCCRAARH